jgi:hypothetical protein
VTKYHHSDHLSERVTTDSAGTAVHTYGHYPFGETWYETGTADKWKFIHSTHSVRSGQASYERDTESSLDYAMFRYDSSPGTVHPFDSPATAGSLSTSDGGSDSQYPR